jgi:hypothetical protein
MLIKRRGFLAYAGVTWSLRASKRTGVLDRADAMGAKYGVLDCAAYDLQTRSDSFAEKSSDLQLSRAGLFARWLHVGLVPESNGD